MLKQKALIKQGLITGGVWLQSVKRSTQRISQTNDEDGPAHSVQPLTTLPPYQLIVTEQSFHYFTQNICEISTEPGVDTINRRDPIVHVLFVVYDIHKGMTLFSITYEEYNLI